MNFLKMLALFLVAILIPQALAVYQLPATKMGGNLNLGGYLVNNSPTLSYLNTTSSNLGTYLGTNVTRISNLEANVSPLQAAIVPATIAALLYNTAPISTMKTDLSTDVANLLSNSSRIGIVESGLTSAQITLANVSPLQADATNLRNAATAINVSLGNNVTKLLSNSSRIGVLEKRNHGTVQGTGSEQAIEHGLGIVPTQIWVCARGAMAAPYLTNTSPTNTYIYAASTINEYYDWYAAE